ncbi:MULTISPECIES: helix-turn-helix transcriptional regulator [Pandoraea]|uniref:Shikimate kinase n=1 Tax=Pandoraea communis TaxID=2508297 RepID=A0A5E4TFC5_9BURK|nr:MULTISPECIES: helix-turn-helix transcriptional regulator [Pandoraea]EON11384.1 anaerobic benzoate catabolism transcriptional regulator [Pandoraea sp. SD6-2]VVD84839.1 anaerobic benzoate catabolism transcriptional regulator [Pandoraea communis]
MRKPLADSAPPDLDDDTEAGVSSRLASLAQQVRTLRAQRGMTRKQLAAQSGVSLPYLARVEAGTGNVSLAVLHKLSEALNVGVETLVAERTAYDGDLLILVEYLRQQPPEVLSRLRRQIVVPGVTDARRTGQRIALIGLRGAGKSTLGPQLAQAIGAPFIELDKEVEREAGIAIGEVITLYGQAAMRRIERQCIERIIADHEHVVLATGGGIVSEAPTYERVLRAFRTVWLRARPEVHFQRVMQQNDARIATEALRNEALEHIHRMLDARESLYRLADITLDTSDLTPQAALAALKNDLTPARAA